MEHFAGLDVGVKETSVCVVDKDGTGMSDTCVDGPFGASRI